MKTYNLWKTILHLGCTPLRGFWLPKLLKACNKPTLFSSFCPASVLGSHSKASLHTGITCKPQPHKDSHHQFSALGQVMLLQNTSGMNKINKNPNSKALDSDLNHTAPSCQSPGLAQSCSHPTEPRVPFGVCAAAQFDKEMLPHSSSLSHLSQTTPILALFLPRGETSLLTLNLHGREYWTYPLHYRATDISDSTHSFWFFFPLPNSSLTNDKSL